MTPKKIVKFEKQLPSARENDLKQGGGGFRWMDLKIARGIMVEDTLVPSFWRHISKDLMPGDMIRVRSVDGELDFFVTIEYAGKTEAVARLYMRAEQKPTVKIEGGAYRVEWTQSTVTQWGVFARDSKEPEKTGFPTEQAGWDYISRHKLAS